MTELQACDFKDPGSLKDILEELGKLYTTGTMPKVFEKLKSYLEPYCGEGYLQAFYKDLGSGRGGSYAGSGYIQALTQAAEGIGRELLQNPSWHDRYVDPHVSHKDQTCGEKYFNALKACLPKAYAALLFLFFNCDSGCRNFGGGSWNTLKVKGSDSENSLYNWLIGEDSGSDLPGGFSKEELHGSKTGQSLVGPLKSAVSLTLGSDAGSLQNVLCGFMFVCKWDVSLLGHAICFLYKFCEKVSQGSEDLFQGKYKEHSGAFKDVCRGLKSSLTPFIDGSSGLYAVCQKNTNLFKDLWDNEKFLTYCEWLKDNLHYIIEALQTMFLESSQWSSNHLMSGSSAGPFKYGFVFKASWTSGSTSESKLEGYISKLTGEDSGSLQKFISFLEHPSTPSSTAATAAGAAGGIFGLGGAGAGAAYGLNLFGFKNLVTGLISSFLK